MTNKKIQADELTNEITKMLTEYTEEVTDIAKQVVDKVAEGTMQEVKSHITWKDKSYASKFALNTSFENKRNKRRTWYVKSPYYRLTHLLEFGHHTRRIKHGKAYTQAYPHVKYGDEYVKNNLEREMKEAIENARA